VSDVVSGVVLEAIVSGCVPVVVITEIFVVASSDSVFVDVSCVVSLLSVCVVVSGKALVENERGDVSDVVSGVVLEAIVSGDVPVVVITEIFVVASSDSVSVIVSCVVSLLSVCVVVSGKALKENERGEVSDVVSGVVLEAIVSGCVPVVLITEIFVVASSDSVSVDVSCVVSWLSVCVVVPGKALKENE